MEISDRPSRSVQPQGLFLAGITGKVRTFYVQNVNLDAAAHRPNYQWISQISSLKIKLSSRPDGSGK